MWNFLEFLWAVSGVFSAYYAIKDCLKRDGQITAKSAAIIGGFFLGGLISAIFIISNDGDSIVLFKDKPNANQAQKQTQAPVSGASPQAASPGPSTQPSHASYQQSVAATPKGGSVLDG